MKKLIIISISLTIFISRLGAQDHNTETEIRRLEQMEVQAILNKDTLVLSKLWDKNYIVNSPDNVIILPGKTVVDRPVLKRSRTSFTREIEQIIIRGNTAISMGNETITPSGDQPLTGQTVKRRYTNIWMKYDGEWRLVARHANLICK